MVKPPVPIIVRLFLLLAVVTMTGGWLINCKSAKEPRLMIPNEEFRVSIFFESTGLASKSINQLTHEANLSPLRTVVLPDDDLEVRV